MKHQNVFWGTLLVGFGSLLLLDRLDMIYFNWYSMGKLWPFLLILWGVSILPVKGGVKLVLALLVAAFSVVTYTQFQSDSFQSNKSKRNYNIHKDWEEEDLQKEVQYFSEPYLDQVKQAKLHMDAGAGSFVLNGTTSELLIAENRSNVAGFTFKTEAKDSTSSIYINQNSDLKFGKNNKGNQFSLMLNPTPLWSFDFNIGAAEFDFDFSEHKVEKIDIDGGAASIRLNIGTLYDRTDININAGASSIKIEIPETAGCRLEGATVLSSRNLDGFEKIDKGLYETPDFEAAQQKIYIKVDAAVSSFTIKKK